MLTFSNITSFLKRNKKILYYTGFFVVLFMIGSGDVFATPLLTDGSGGGTTLGTDANPITPAIASAKTSFIQILNSAFKFIAMLLGLLTNFVGLFLNPSWTNGSIFGLETHLKSLWIFVSNIVYFIFALLLILIAFMNIVGKGDKWELKQALPKFIIGVLMVPFSWFLVNFIISVSSILGASILQLPYDTLKSSADTKTFQSLEKVKICTYLKISKAKKSSTNGISIDSEIRCDSKKSISDILQGNSAYGMLSIYTYGIFSIDDSQKTFAKEITPAGGVETIFDLGYKTLIGLLLAVVYFILVLSLFLALFVRGIWLWLYMIFSPIFGLMIFFGKEKDGFMEGKFSLTELISLAMVPVYVSAALSFGLLFIFVAGQGLAQPSDTKIFSVNPVEGGSGTIINLMGGSKDGGFSFELEQSLSNSAKSGNDSMSQLFKAFKGGLGTLIMQLFGIVVLWISVIAALKSSKVTGEIIEPIAAFGKSVGQLAMKSPQYAPVFGGQSMKSMNQIGNLAQGELSTSTSKRAQKLWDKMPFGSDKVSSAQQNLKGQIESANSPEAYTKAARDILKATKGDATKLYNNLSARQNLFNIASKVLGKDKLSTLNITSASSIGKPDDVRKIFIAMEEKDNGNYGGMIKGAATNSIQWKDIVRNINDLNTGTSTPDSSNGGDNSGVKKVPAGATHYDITINGTTGKVKSNEDGKIIDLLSTGDDIARHIFDNKMNTTSVEDLYNKLDGLKGLSSQLNKYFKKSSDGNTIVFDGSGTGTLEHTLEDFLKQNDTPPTS